MKFNEKYEINKDFESIFKFKSDAEELKHEAYMLMFKFLSEIERVTEHTIYKKDLAKALDTSRSFVSQLFSGDKLANFTSIAKLQKSYNLTFEITAIPNKINVVPITNFDTNEYNYSHNEENINYDNQLVFVLGKQSNRLQQVS